MGGARIEQSWGLVFALIPARTWRRKQRSTMQPGAPGGWNPQGPPGGAGYGQAPAPGGYGQPGAPAPGGYGQPGAPAPGGYGQPGGGFGGPGGAPAVGGVASLQKGFFAGLF